MPVRYFWEHMHRNRWAITDAGPNHVLPTSGTARFFSPLGVQSFTKRSSYTYYTKDALHAAKDDIVLIANKEGLTAHANAITVRFEDEEK